MKARILIYSLLLTFNNISQALTLNAPDRPGDSLIGSPPNEMPMVAAKQEDTLIDIALNYKLGQDEIVLANPNVDRWLPGAGTKVRIPNGFLLPEAGREGIVINLPEMRIYYFSADRSKVLTYAVGIGREDDWKTPIGKTHIAAKTENPSWSPPPSIIAEHAADGDILQPYYPPGPDNPLGLFAFKLGLPGYLIHSTNKINGVGMRVSHGCIRMYPEDIEKFFPMVKTGTIVNIVNQPTKVGWYHDTLFIETYPALEETPVSYEQRLEIALDLILKANGGQMPTIKGALLKKVIEKPTGIPIPIYQRPAPPSPVVQLVP